MAEPAPLPPPREDPAITAGNAAQEVYQARRAAIDDDTTLDELARTEAIVEAYEQHLAVLNAHAQDLHDRRAARAEHLKAQLPLGPGIPDDASPADRAVLMAEFRAALERARSVVGEKSKSMLAEGLRFGDELHVRAVLTVAEERAEGQLFDQWAQATGNTPLLAELRELTSALNGMGSGRAWEAQAFRAPKRPANEIANLPALRRRAEEEARDEARRRQAATPVYRRY